MMTGTRITQPRRPACWRAVCRVAAALRDLHREQVYAWECLLRASRAPVDRPGPLTWTPSLDGPRLTGSWLPTA